MPEFRDVMASGDVNYANLGRLRIHEFGPNDEGKILELQDGIGTVGVTTPSVTTIFAVADEDILEGQVVVSVPDVKVAIASNDDLTTMDQVVGLAVHDALLGEPIEVATDGVMMSQNFNFVPGGVYVDVAGAVTQVVPFPPAALFLLKIGTASSANVLSIDLDRPVLLLEEPA